jgi:hypothetical protein
MQEEEEYVPKYFLPSWQPAVLVSLSQTKL